MVKICRKCKMELPLNEKFYCHRKDKKDGWDTECKQCKHERGKEYYWKNREIIRANYKQYRQDNKEKERERHLNYLANNMEKRKEYERQWYQKNKEKILENQKEYKIIYRANSKDKRKQYLNTEKSKEMARSYTNKRRALKKQLEATLTQQQWLECIAYFKNKCAYCGKDLDKAYQDHFIPLSKGGAYNKINIIASCQFCNLSKFTRDFFVWYPKQIFYSIDREQRIMQYLSYNSEEKLCDGG